MSQSVTSYTNQSLSVEITKPKDGYLYIFDREISFTGTTLVIGKIHIEAEVISDYYTKKVDFYIDGELKKSDYVEPYTCLLEDTLFFSHIIKAEAFDLEETKAEDEVKMLMFNIRTNELLNEDEASQILIEEVIKPSELNHDIIAYTLHSLLNAGDIISSINIEYIISSPTWFFWIDDMPYVQFVHPTRYVFIDAKSGEIELIDGYLPPVLNNECIWNNEEFWDKNNWVFSTYFLSNSSYYNDVNDVAVNVENEGGKKVAILVEGEGKPSASKDCEGMNETLSKIGFKGTILKGANLKEKLKEKIEDASKNLEPGDTFLLYITSHGLQYEKKNEKINLILKYKDIKQNHKKACLALNIKWEGILYDYELANWLAKMKDCVNIKVIIDACVSGGFIDDLENLKMKNNQPKIEVILTSTDCDSLSFFDLPKEVKENDPQWGILYLFLKKMHIRWKRDPNDDLGKTEFTGGLVDGINKNKGEKEQTELFEKAFDESLKLNAAILNREIIKKYYKIIYGNEKLLEENPQKVIRKKEICKPKVKIQTPKNGETTKDKNCSLSGYATDNVGIVKIGYIHKALDYFYGYNETIASTQNYSFEWEIELIEGWNNLTVYAIDEAGNEGEDNVTVYYYPEDVEPPFVEITWPEDEYESEIANITIVGYANDTVGIVSIGSHHEWEDGETWTSGTVDPPVQHLEFEWNFTLHEGWNRITIFAEDEAGNEGNDSVIVFYYPGNHPPNQPTMPEGPTEGEVGESLYFSSYFTDPDGDSMEIMFDWGDGSNTGWIGVIANGTTVGNYHTYTSPGTYEVRAKARDIPYMAESEWSEALTVNIS